MIQKAFAPSNEWGPKAKKDRQKWMIFKEEKSKTRNLRKRSKIVQTLYILLKFKPK